MTLAAPVMSDSDLFEPVVRCWVCGGDRLERFHQLRFDFHEYAQQDPGLHVYTGRTGWLVRCAGCGFGQPEALPTLARFFDRMYDQRWSEDWVEREFDSPYKDLIFRTILRELDSRVLVTAPGARGDSSRVRRLLDIGAHAGRFMHVAKQDGWSVEGIELNPRTAACAARRTGAPVHQVNARALVSDNRCFDAITLTDVLEHIPDPVALLTTVAKLVAPGGAIAIKVPCGRSQWHKERVLSAIRPSHAVSLAGNLVHVNHFTPASLRMALERAGFATIVVRTAAPELPPDGTGLRRLASSAIRLGVYGAARLPGGVHTPLALNLQAYGERPR